MREVVVLAADVPDEATPGLVFEYEFHTGDASMDTTAKVRQLRQQTLGRLR